MSEPTAVHQDRRRAESFGAVADRYDRYRPRYPEQLITALVPAAGLATLDVGAGTGIASRQLLAAGADVLAVEPDANMAAVASDKGVRVEVASFEQWEPAGRTFDLVVFAQSFHWVEPVSALRTVAALLNPGGRLALLWNRIRPDTPTPEQFDAAYAGVLDEWRRAPSSDVEGGDQLTALLDAAGFVSAQHHYVERLHYCTEDWVDMVTTYSNVLTLEPDVRAELRGRLEQCIGAAGVDATNDALAIVCQLR